MYAAVIEPLRSIVVRKTYKEGNYSIEETIKGIRKNIVPNLHLFHKYSPRILTFKTFFNLRGAVQHVGTQGICSPNPVWNYVQGRKNFIFESVSSFSH